MPVLFRECCVIMEEPITSHFLPTAFKLWPYVRYACSCDYSSPESRPAYIVFLDLFCSLTDVLLRIQWNHRAEPTPTRTPCDTVTTVCFAVFSTPAC